MSGRIRVLVVDDSAFVRQALRSMLERAPDLEVVGIARDGLDALDKIAALQPDVVTLDLSMPNLDGLGVLRALGGAPSPRVLVVSIDGAESDLGVAALQAGAIDVVEKPTVLAEPRLTALQRDLLDKVRLAARAQRRPDLRVLTPPVGAVPPSARLVVMGASTGGPQALTHLLSALPAEFPVPIALVLHIPVGYTEPFARRVDQLSRLRIVEAADGLPLERGMAAVARAGLHLRIERAGDIPVCRLDMNPLTSLHRPAVDILFQSAATSFGAQVLGVILTGMGSDGTAGARAIRKAGGQVITEAESTCVVYGMPRSVREAGFSDAEVPLNEVAAEIQRRL